MFKHSPLMLLIGSALIAGQVSAASIDFRHEYRGSSERHSSRVKINESIGDLYFSGELKFNGENGKFMEDLKNNGWEFDWGYRFRLNDNWTLQPGMPIEGRTGGMTYKPQVRLTYAFDQVEGLTLSGRYRHDFKTYSNGDSTEKRHRVTGNVGYRMNDWQFGLEMNYYKAEGYELYDGKDTNYENNISIRYRPGAWSPYVEFGDVSYSRPENEGGDKRELRSRVGITYSF
ncbi:N-acetylneuraminic acid outer membrane channel protein NanC [Photobacterium rosenbergii]|uniref:N-acetylneuraminic acid outer membrane channel protein NanC n=1 Tax=Photobacterium rosenbergii TaxID=294936 RepID=A0A2T3NAY9_9GAMM|nr:oligogalacturonate-specific porin KdgM family protein [Photobacterium rosenbergii]PSW10852.1 N-acetylneuraminic acid outer membrane channel protein NanC [Photobacterium rosenbergii]